MPLLVLPFNYLWWHYTLAWRDLGLIYRNFLWFTYHFFSLPVLARTLFAPWKRLGESYPTHFDLAATLSTLLINSLMRIVGFLFRSVMLIVGVAVWGAVFSLGLLVFVLWLVLPVLVVFIFILGIKLFVTTDV